MLNTTINHPLIRGLFDCLPEPGAPIPDQELANWLETFARCLDLIYNSQPSIITPNAYPYVGGSHVTPKA